MFSCRTVFFNIKIHSCKFSQLSPPISAKYRWKQMAKRILSLLCITSNRLCKKVELPIWAWKSVLLTFRASMKIQLSKAEQTNQSGGFVFWVLFPYGLILKLRVDLSTPLFFVCRTKKLWWLLLIENQKPPFSQHLAWIQNLGHMEPFGGTKTPKLMIETFFFNINNYLKSPFMCVCKLS